MIQLKIMKGPQEGTLFKLQEESFSIGRSRSNEVILYDDKVSSRHAAVVRSAGKIIVRDLGSTNGTFINELPVDAAVIKNGDLLRVGDTEMVFHFSQMQPSTDTVVRLVSDEPGAGPTIRETVRSSEGSTIFDVDLGEVSLDSLAAAHRNLRALYRVNSVFNSTFDLPKLFERIMDQIFEVTLADRGVLMVVENQPLSPSASSSPSASPTPSPNLVPKVIRAREEEKDVRLVLSRTIVNQVLQRGSGILTSDAMSDDRFSSGESVAAFHIRSAMCVPIRYKEQTIGIIYVDTKISSGTFNRSDLELLTALGNEAGVAIENAKLYEANVRAERLAVLGEALANLSHYIKNVLMCMQGGGQLVQKALEEKNLASLEKGWNIVRRNERKLSGLVMDMLSYCKERQPLYEKCDLGEVVRDVIDLSGPLLEEKAIAIEHNLDEQKASAEIDAEGIVRCLLNILTNAIDAVESGKGRISIKIGKDEQAKRVFIAVTDNGCGIPPDVQPRIFEAFCSTKGSKGTGLGLAVVAKTVKEHCGSIDVQTKPGQGSTFTIHLPAVSRPGVQKFRSPHQEPGTSHGSHH